MTRRMNPSNTRWSPLAAAVLTSLLLGVASEAAAQDESSPESASTGPEYSTPQDAPYFLTDALEDGPAGGTAPAPAAKLAESAPSAEKQLEKRVNELEETVRLLKEELKALKPTSSPGAPSPTKAGEKKPTPSPGSSGPAFALQSADGKGRIAFRGWIQGGLRLFPNDSGRSSLDQFFLRRVRPSIEGVLNPNLGFRIQPDFSSFGASLLDAYLDLRLNPSAALRAGKFKEPLSLERLQAGADFLLIERSLSNNLAPNRDVGVQLFGDLFDRRLGYQLAVFNGVPDGVSAETDTDSDKDFAGRIFAHPFRGSGKKALEGIGVGVGATIGGRDQSPAGTYRTAARAPFFALASGGVSDGTQVRLAPQLYYFHGPFGFQAEHYTSRQDVVRGAARDAMTNRGWYGQASYVLTGEKASYERVVPNHPFDPQKGDWGAFEVALRWSELRIDPDVFTRGIANRAASAQDLHAFTLGLNWHLSSALKVQLNYERTDFGRPITLGGGQRDHESLVLGQVQIVF